MKGVSKINYMIIFLIIVGACGCISPKIKFHTGGLEEEFIDLPHIFNMDDGKKMKISDMVIKKVDYVVSMEQRRQSDQENLSTVYKIYYPREGFVFLCGEYNDREYRGKDT